jgi:hypothetical protein
LADATTPNLIRVPSWAATISVETTADAQARTASRTIALAIAMERTRTMRTSV